MTGDATVSPSAVGALHPVARAVLAWMQAEGGRLRVLIDEELVAAGGADAPTEELTPAGDPAIRAHLRFLAEALAATAAPGESGMARFSDGLPSALADAEGARIAAEIERVGDATAFELELQFGSEVVDDAALHAVAERRIRIAAWTRVYLDELDAARGGPPVADAALEWMGDRQVKLADTIFSMDRRAKQAEIVRSGPRAVDDPDTVNRIGQAAMLQAHVRFLVEALAATLAAPSRARS